MQGFGDLIKCARKKKKLTQEALGQIIGVTKTTVCDWEREKYPPTNATNINALEQALEFEDGYLYRLMYGNPTNPQAKDAVSGETQGRKTA